MVGLNKKLKYLKMLTPFNAFWKLEKIDLVHFKEIGIYFKLIYKGVSDKVIGSLLLITHTRPILRIQLAYDYYWCRINAAHVARDIKKGLFSVIALHIFS